MRAVVGVSSRAFNSSRRPLVPDNLLFLLLLLDDILRFSELHLCVLISLLESGFAVRFIGIRVLPEFPNEVSFLSSVVILLDELDLEEIRFYLASQIHINMLNFIEEGLCKFVRNFSARLLMYLLENIYHFLKLIFC